MSYLKFFLTNLLLININNGNVECCTALSNVCCDPKFYGAMCILYWLFVLGTNIYAIFGGITILNIISAVFNTIWYLCLSCFVFRSSNTKKTRRAKTVLIILDSLLMLANGIFCSTVIYMSFTNAVLGIYPFDTLWINLFIGLRVSCNVTDGQFTGCDMNKSLLVVFFFLLAILILFKFIGMVNIFHHISTNKEERQTLIEDNTNYLQREYDDTDENDEKRNNNRRNSKKNRKSNDDSDSEEDEKRAHVVVKNYNNNKEEGNVELRKTLTDLSKKIDNIEKKLPQSSQNIEMSLIDRLEKIEKSTEKVQKYTEYLANKVESAHEEKSMVHSNILPSEFREEDIEK